MHCNHKLSGKQIPKRLREIKSPPKELFVAGKDLSALLEKPVLAVVGSRKVSPYGREVTEKIVSEVAGKGVVIVSGLAIGVDTCAHKAALDVNGATIAVLPTSLAHIEPQTNQRLAEKIVESSGALITEYGEDSDIHRANFVMRNRLVSGLADAVLIPEAAEKSGTMHTASYSRQQHKPLLVVPGPINSPLSRGPNKLLKSGASAVTEANDVFAALGIIPKFKQQTALIAATEEEKLILSVLEQGIADGHILQQKSHLPPDIFSQTLTMLELSGVIKSLGNNRWSLV